MHKRVVLLILFVGCINTITGQILNPLRSKEWDIIAHLYYKSDGKGKMVPVYPPDLQQLHNKNVILPGYMIPIRASMAHTNFLLSVLPLEQCGFCGTDNFPIMIETFVAKPLRYTDKVMRVEGKLILNLSRERGKAEITLIDAHIVD